MSSNGGWWQPPRPTPPGPRMGPPMGPPPGQWPGMGPGGPWAHVPPPPKPGVIPLRPLSIGDIISGIFMTIRYNFLAVYGPVLVTGLGCVVLFAILGTTEWSPLHTFWVDAKNNADTQGWHPSSSEITNAAVAFGLLTLLILVSFLAIYTSANLGSVATLRHAVVGRRVNFKQSMREGLPHLWRLLGATLLMGLAAFAGLIVAVGLAFLVGVTAGAGAGAAAGLLLYFPAGLWGVYLQIRLMPLPGVVMLEGAGPVTAIKRAWRLNSGAWWRSFGTLFLITLLSGVVGSVATMPFSLWASTVSGFSNVATSNPNDPNQLRALLIAELLYFALVMPVSAVTNLLTLPLTTTSQGLMYIDRRIRRESLDLQLAEEAGFLLHQPTAPHAEPTVPTQASSPRQEAAAEDSAPAAPEDAPPTP
ncbi:hypothetical protein [Streptacidiphilus sp. MAP5-3]|uniref:hypothetical protein n=1 Tax=unclassified Streptacidiphilus TaxID=2643834 RepID=UPI003518A715